MTDDADILEEVLSELDALLCRRLQERGLEGPHLIIAATKESQAVLRSNVGPDGLREGLDRDR